MELSSIVQGAPSPTHGSDHTDGAGSASPGNQQDADMAPAEEAGTEISPQMKERIAAITKKIEDLSEEASSLLASCREAMEAAMKNWEERILGSYREQVGRWVSDIELLEAADRASGQLQQRIQQAHCLLSPRARPAGPAPDSPSTPE